MKPNLLLEGSDAPPGKIDLANCRGLSISFCGSVRYLSNNLHWWFCKYMKWLFLATSSPSGPIQESLSNKLGCGNLAKNKTHAGKACGYFEACEPNLVWRSGEKINGWKRSKRDKFGECSHTDKNRIIFLWNLLAQLRRLIMRFTVLGFLGMIRERFEERCILKQAILVCEYSISGVVKIW